MKKKEQFLDEEDHGDILLARIRPGEVFGEADVNEFGSQIFALVEEKGKKRIILSFKDVTRIDSSCLGKLITLNKKVRQVKGRLVLCNVPEWFWEMLEITRLLGLFNATKEDEFRALAQF